MRRLPTLSKSEAPHSPPNQPTRPTSTSPHNSSMRWESPGHVWSVRVYERRGMLWGEIHHHRMLSWHGRLTANTAHDELNTELAELGAPRLEDMVELR